MHDVLQSMRIDLETRDLTENTVTTYLRYARKFVAEVGKPLRKVSRDDLRQYLMHLIDNYLAVRRTVGFKLRTTATAFQRVSARSLRPLPRMRRST